LWKFDTPVANSRQQVVAVKLLHIDSSILGDHSVSRQLSAAVVSRLRERTPGITVLYRDLAAAPVVHLTGLILAAAPGSEQDVTHGKAVLDEFLEADILVMGVPMYNFTVPTQLKAWIDRILVADRTFRYTEKGPVGLAGDKRVLVALSRGGFYGPDSDNAALDHQEPYLRAVFGFIGIKSVEFLRAEGIAISSTQRQVSLDRALRMAASIGN